MDRKILTFLYTILVAFLFSSCEKDANIPVPEEDPKLVVYSYISPSDTLVRVSVSQSVPIFGNNNTGETVPVTNATVVISSPAGSHTLTYDPYLEQYSIHGDSIHVTAGQTYSLTVSAPGFETVSASTTVPQLNNFNFQVNETAAHPVSVYNGNTIPRWYSYNIRFTHFNNSDYYRVIPAYYKVYPGYPDSLENEYGALLYDYNKVSGGMITDNIDVYTDIVSEPHPDPYGVKLHLVISTQDYHKFHSSLQNYSYGDPFAEPSLIYTNMTNGYGIFAGYLQETVQIHY
ncbi:MAG TPA: DUF4249 domain-containing protein [Flavobacteriales bacterium]|nr:DUF4249 domain-containing protein [Flavobacteriales bacterium]